MYLIFTTTFSIYFLNHVRLCNPKDCSTPGCPVHHQLLELTQTHICWIGDAIQPSHPLSSCSPSAINFSHHQDHFKLVSSSHQMAKYWSFSYSISPSNEYSGLISFPSGWTGCNCIPRDSQESSPHHRSKASILWCSAFFIVQLSHPYMITGKTTALTRWTFVGKVMSLLVKLCYLYNSFLKKKAEYLVFGLGANT